MQLNELRKGDCIVAKYGSEYRKMDILSNDPDRKQLVLEIHINVGMFDTVKRLEVIDYNAYNLKQWGKLEEQISDEKVAGIKNES